MYEGIYEDTVLRTIALGIARNQVGAQLPIEQVLPILGVEEDEYERLCENRAFVRYVEQYEQELTENGFSFAAKARVLAEDLLPVAYSMAKDDLVPPPVRAKMIENLVDWGGLKPKNNAIDVPPGSGFSIMINLGGNHEAAVKQAKKAEKPVIEGDFSEKMPKIGRKKAEKEVIEEAEIVEEEPLREVKNKLAGLFDDEDDYVYAGDDVFL